MEVSFQAYLVKDHNPDFETYIKTDNIDDIKKIYVNPTTDEVRKLKTIFEQFELKMNPKSFGIKTSNTSNKISLNILSKPKETWYDFLYQIKVKIRKIQYYDKKYYNIELISLAL